MKVIAINGSPNENGNTAASINTIAGVLKENDIKTETVTIGTMPIRGCIGCKSCHKTGKCIFDDGLNEIAEKMSNADGIIVGSPVYYAGINGTLKSFLDRVFYSKGATFRFKPAAALVVARRAGTTAALQTIKHYFEITEMLMTPSAYWSGVHGNSGGDAVNDLEGMQLMTQLGKNMAYIMKLTENSRISVPEKDERVRFNYIR